MTSPRNDEIQTAIITKLKATNTIVAELVAGGTGAVEIREDEWQGDEFDYPNIRVRIISNVPSGDTGDCSLATISVSIMAFSQGYSTIEADRIAGIIGTSLNLKSFTANSIAIVLRTTNLIPAVRIGKLTWRAECLMSGEASLLA